MIRPQSNKLKSWKKIVPLAPDVQLAPYRLPMPKSGHIPGQMALDFSSDDPDALIDPSGEES